MMSAALHDCVGTRVRDHVYLESVIYPYEIYFKIARVH